MLKKKAVKKLCKKAPAKFLLQNTKLLKKLVSSPFILILLFVLLNNFFKDYEVFINLPGQLGAAQKVMMSIPDFIKVFPQEAEKNSFAFFDWTKARLDSFGPIFAKETISTDQEAGQSATKKNSTLLPT